MVSEILASVIIAIVQGLTEWIPVSSSGHLVLVEKLLGFSGGLEFDVALHFGTLMAVFVYFGKDIVDILQEMFRGDFKSENGRLGLLIVVATIPAGLTGFFLKDVFSLAFGSLGVTAMGFGVTGVFLMVASFSRSASRQLSQKGKVVNYNGDGKRIVNSEELGWRKFGFWNAFLVGVTQVFALFPGVSRSGSTIGSGLLLGLDEKATLKFSFLMSIPIIFGANILVIGNNTLPSNLIWATIVSFAIGLLTIYLLYEKILVNRRNLRWFGVYALALALVLGVVLAV